MSDESDPIAPPSESGAQGLDSSRPDPIVIKGQIADAPSPPPERASPPPARRNGLAPFWLAPTAIAGGLIGYGLVQMLNPPPDLSGVTTSIQAVKDAQSVAATGVDALGKRVAALDSALSGAAKASDANGSDVKSLAKRVDGVEKTVGDALLTAQAAQTPAPMASPAPDLSLGSARLDALDASVKALEAKPDSAAPLQDRIAALEAAVTQLKTAPSRDGLALSALIEGLSLRFESGAAFAGELETLKRLGADGGSLAALAPMAQSGAPTPQKIVAAFEALAPTLAPAPSPAPTPAPNADQGMMAGLIAKMSSLVKVRVKDAPVSVDPSAPSQQIRTALAKGDFAAAATAFAPLKDKAGAAGDAWLGLIDQRTRGLAAIAKLRAQADDALKAAAP